MEDRIKKINKYLDSPQKYINAPLKKKENKQNCINLKDGLFVFKISLEPYMQCQCSSANCSHIFYILFGMYNLSFTNVLHLDKAYDTFLLHRKDADLNEKLKDAIHKHYSRDDCGICLANLTVYTGPSSEYLHFFACVSCSKFAHTKCANKWFQKSNTCVYCRFEFNDIFPKTIKP